ncbi:hypothetical protein AVMA1855_06095 [Acidovorax sp. SUPP1855]|uniref:hypothetical protein n=1 Tax=Acidovorax sp. SUPP1855 TaxID=431774 RepID=UPI0023DE28B9|nr:hypothetical protein [Acidovorax sp. SUPP1855]GKS83693.1 hypothetical protein AVMA1855_06095 [Acidovorax sp. SUPP1855]
MKINLEKAKSEVILLGKSFFEGNKNLLKKHFNLSDELIEEGFEQLKISTKDCYKDLSPPPTTCDFSIEEDDDDEENESAPLRIYKLDTGGWGYEMDIFRSERKTDVTMRGEYPTDFNENGNIKFHLFEVM